MHFALAVVTDDKPTESMLADALAPFGPARSEPKWDWIAHLRMGGPIADTPAKIPKQGRPGPGRPPGSKNKISRTMREALAAAVEELGRTDLDQWEAVVQKAADHPDPYKRFFMVAAIKEMKTFLAVVARIIPSHVIHTPAQKYMTVAQARAEL